MSDEGSKKPSTVLGFSRERERGRWKGLAGPAKSDWMWWTSQVSFNCRDRNPV